MAGHRYHAFANVPPHDLAPLPRARLVGRPWMWVARKLFREMEREQLRWAIQSFLDGAVVGSGCRLTGRAWCVNSGPKASIRIGDHVICRGLVRSEDFHPGEIIIGDEVYLGDDTILSSAERIKIGRGTMLAHGVHVFDNDSHPLHADLRERDRRIAVGIESGPRDDIVSAPIEIGEDAWIGFNSIILKGVRIGRGSVIAAGSVVTADVPPDTIVAGNPARVVREIGTSAVLES